MDHVDIGGLRIAYERAGIGPPLFLIHGYVGDGPATLRHQLDELLANPAGSNAASREPPPGTQ